MHFDAWPSETWPDLDLLGPFVHALSKREIQVMRKSLDSYIPPVVIQSHDGLGRGPVVWVSTILMKDIEKKECFDVEDLAKKCARARPGAFSKKIHFCVLLALAFRLASLGGWTALEQEIERTPHDIYREIVVECEQIERSGTSSPLSDFDSSPTTPTNLPLPSPSPLTASPYPPPLDTFVADPHAQSYAVMLPDDGYLGGCMNAPPPYSLIPTTPLQDAPGIFPGAMLEPFANQSLLIPQIKREDSM
ncbi:hypothetical protein GCK32_014865, partial [Trichostrongylus colubriformis]